MKIIPVSKAACLNLTASELRNTLAVVLGGGGRPTMHRMSNPQKSYELGWEVPYFFENTRIKPDCRGLPAPPSAAGPHKPGGFEPPIPTSAVEKFVGESCYSGWIWRLNLSSFFGSGCSDSRYLTPLHMPMAQAGCSDHLGPQCCRPKLLIWTRACSLLTRCSQLCVMEF